MHLQSLGDVTVGGGAELTFVGGRGEKIFKIFRS